MAAKRLKYLEIYEWLSDRIQEGTYSAGDKIPNEEELASMFKVHRMTVRQAIDKLVSDHMLVRKRGIGTFLLSEKKPVLVRSLQSISTYFDDIQASGLQPQYVTLEAKTIPATERIADPLNMAIGDNVLFLHRVMLASGVPLVLEKAYLPQDLFPDLIDDDMNTILYKVISEKYNMRLMHSRQEIGAVLPNEREKNALKITDNCPCLWVESVVYNDVGRAVEFSRSLHRGDKYRFKCSIGQYVHSGIDGGVQ